jgi:hypothetical protein
MLEISIIHVYRHRLQTQLAAGTLGLLAVTGCAEEDTRPDRGAAADPTPVVLRAESASVDAYAAEDPSWKECHGEGGIDTPFEVPPGGEFYPQMEFDAPWTEPVQAIAFKILADNTKVLHHWILYNGPTMITGWAPGRENNPYPPDVGMELLPGAKGIRLDMHYYNTRGTKAEPDRSGVAICVVKGEKKRKYTAGVYGGFSAFGDVMVPPNTRNHPLERTCTVTSDEPVQLMRVTPHAHERARHMHLSIKRADTAVEEVLHDGSFNFDEQDGYDLRPLVQLNKGDVVKSICTYDNDSNKVISWGESTDQEMCFLWTVYYPKGALKCVQPPGTPTITRRPAAATPTTPAANAPSAM